MTRILNYSYPLSFFVILNDSEKSDNACLEMYCLRYQILCFSQDDKGV